jgi:hypothetical protein
MPYAFSAVRAGISPVKRLVLQLVVSGSVLLGTIVLLTSVCCLVAVD